MSNTILTQVRALSSNVGVFQRAVGELTVRAMTIMESFDSNTGLCIRCWEEVDGVEPDACGYRCDECDTWTVYGAEEVFLSVAPLA